MLSIPRRSIAYLFSPLPDSIKAVHNLKGRPQCRFTVSPRRFSSWYELVSLVCYLLAISIDLHCRPYATMVASWCRVQKERHRTCCGISASGSTTRKVNASPLSQMPINGKSEAEEDTSLFNLGIASESCHHDENTLFYSVFRTVSFKHRKSICEGTSETLTFKHTTFHCQSL